MFHLRDLRIVTTCPIGLPVCADWKSAFLSTLCRASAQAEGLWRATLVGTQAVTENQNI